MSRTIRISLYGVLLTFLFIFINNIAFAKMDKFRCIWRDNPSTTMTVAWNQVSGANPILYYGTSDNGTSTEQYANNKQPSKVVRAKGLNNNFVRLTNLQPNTKYYFVIKDSNSKTKRFWFQTAPNTPSERLSILAGGDSRNHRKGRQNANMLVAKLRPHCVVFGGDMTGLDIEREWKKWFDDWQLTITSDGKITPIIPARGNHEKSNKTLVDLFDVPNSKVYYALNLGGNLLRVYTLNTMIATGGEQKEWLENDFQNSDHILWKMAQYHHPMRPHTAKKSEGTRLYKSWAKLFYTYNVQLVVECDAHVCKTTYPIRPGYGKGSDEGFIRDDKRGTVYVGEGCWGAPIRPANDAKKWTRATGSFNQIKWVWVGSETIEVRTVKTDNASSVGKLGEQNRFTMPSNINLWSPKTGTVIKIQRRENNPVATTTTKPKPTSRPTKKPSKTKPIVKARPKSTVKAAPKRALMDKLVIQQIEVQTTETEAIITWKTAGEPADVICDVQRSINGVDYTTVARMILLGNTDKPQSYKISDTRFHNQDVPFVYYRLRNTLPNGEEKISTIKKVNAKKATDLKKLDPYEGALHVEYTMPQNGDVTFKLTDEKGHHKIYSTYIKQLKGEQIKRLSLDGIESGVYILTVILSDGSVMYRQVVL